MAGLLQQYVEVVHRGRMKSVTGCAYFDPWYGKRDLLEMIDNQNHPALKRKTKLKHNNLMELFDLALAWGWKSPSRLLDQVSREEISAMLAHQRLRTIMEAIQYEDNRPKGKK